MEFPRMLIFTVFFHSIIRINCCGPQKNMCKNKIESEYCAKLYDKGDCHAWAFRTPEFDGELSNYTDKEMFYSREVNEGCVLTLYDPMGVPHDLEGSKHLMTRNPRRYKRFAPSSTWGLSKPVIPERNKPGVYVSSRFSCKCNKYQGCPGHNSINSKTSSGKSMCAIVYQYSTDDAHTSCFGRTKEVFNGEQLYEFTEKDKIWDDDISAVVVREGCSFTGYENKAYTGSKKTFKEVNADVGDMNNVISSYICKCNFAPLADCSPTEGWKQIQRCHNRGTGEYKCTYWKTSGISTSDTSTNLSQFSQGAIVELGLTLKKIFTAKATSSSQWTWSNSDAFTKVETNEERYVNSFGIPSGKRYAIYQRFGKCGDYTINTHDYELRHENTGTVIEHHV